MLFSFDLKADLAVDMVTIYKILEGLKEHDYLSMVYEAYCHNYNKTKCILDSVAGFKNDLHCGFCETPLNMSRERLRDFYSSLRESGDAVDAGDRKQSGGVV